MGKFLNRYPYSKLKQKVYCIFLQDIFHPSEAKAGILQENCIHTTQADALDHQVISSHGIIYKRSLGHGFICGGIVPTCRV